MVDVASGQVHHVEAASLGNRDAPFGGSAFLAAKPYSLFALLRALAEVLGVLPAHSLAVTPFQVPVAVVE